MQQKTEDKRGHGLCHSDEIHARVNNKVYMAEQTRTQTLRNLKNFTCSVVR